MTHAIIDAEKLAIGRVLFVTKVVGFELAKLSSVGETIAHCLGAVAVMHALTVLRDSNTLSAVKAVMISTFAALNFTLKPIVPVSALTVLVI